MNDIKIGYVALNSDLHVSPGDYRRFVYYAKSKGIKFDQATVGKKYDLVILSQGADVSLWKDYPHGVVVYDLIDSYLSLPRNNIKALLRGFMKYILGKNEKLYFSYWHLIQKMCQRSDMVLCSTVEQKDEISPFCKNVPIILDFHDDVVRDYKSDYCIGEKIKIVWEGLPSNLYQLKFIRKVLLTLSRKYNIELHVITDLSSTVLFGKYNLTSTESRVKKIFTNSVVHKWSKESFSEIACQCDIAVIPIDTAFILNRNKPENKLLLFWRMGIPTITSSTPAYSRTMQGAGLDLACDSDNDWLKNIEKLIKYKQDREISAIKGSAYADKEFGTKKILDEWDKAFRSVGFEF
ncbi:hypothetical protein HOL24_06365 [bacterium]|nr:hypothetical protein [bacterium]